MNSLYYKIIIGGLAVALVFTTILLYNFDKIYQVSPTMNKMKEMGYQNYICELQRELGHNVCMIHGEMITLEENYFEIEYCKLQFEMGFDVCTLSNGTVVKSLDEFDKNK